MKADVWFLIFSLALLVAVCIWMYLLVNNVLPRVGWLLGF